MLNINYVAKLILICLIVTIGQLSLDIYLPSLPEMATAFGSSDTLMQWTITTYLIGFGLSQIFYGHFLGRFGKKNSLLFGLLLFICATLACMMAGDITLLLLFRFLQGCGAGCCPVTGKAIVGDDFSGAALNKAATYMTISWALSPIFAPVLGGYIQHYINWNTNFLFLACYGAIIFLLIAFFMKYDKPKKTQVNTSNSFFKSNLSVLSNASFTGCLLLMTLGFALLISFSLLGPFLFQDYFGLSALNYGQLAFFVGLSYLLGTIFCRLVINQLTTIFLFVVSMLSVVIISLLAMILYAYTDHQLVLVMLVVCFITFIVGIIYPSSLARAMSESGQNRGVASAILGWLPMAGIALYSVFISKINYGEGIFLFSLYLILGVLMLIVYKAFLHDRG